MADRSPLDVLVEDLMPKSADDPVIAEWRTVLAGRLRQSMVETGLVLRDAEDVAAGGSAIELLGEWAAEHDTCTHPIDTGLGLIDCRDSELDETEWCLVCRTVGLIGEEASSNG